MSAETTTQAAHQGTASTVRLPFDNTYIRLPERFYARGVLRPVRSPQLIQLNTALAEELGLEAEVLRSPEGVQVLAGNAVASGSEPLNMAYAGHQFGNFVPTLGDGRAMLLGEVIARSGRRYDVQLKGSGPSFFSRRGDGRAALGPVLREYIVSEAMAAMGIPSTRALAAVLTGERVQRETMLPGGVLTRVASSHIRVGTFQFFAARGDTEGLRLLADHVIGRHYPELDDQTDRYAALLAGVIERQAKLIAQWMLVGFIHGVMNTDNMSVSGETIDYGPCAFMEAYDPATVYSSIDARGRYAYGAQPDIAVWNLSRLAECLLPLMTEEAGTQEAALERAKAALLRFEPQFLAAWERGLRQKIGLETEQPIDRELTAQLLGAMAQNEVDFTVFFRRLANAVASPQREGEVRELFADPAAFDAWASPWRDRLSAEPGTQEERRARMLRVNPAVIPRNHNVEEMIAAAVERGDFYPFRRMLAVVTQPFAETDESKPYQVPARPEERVLETFCGT